jgi:PEP-CTERM motif
MGLVAFPGADGFGENAVGGRGGAVYHVTNLTDNTTTPAPGSFRAVLAQISTDEFRKTNPVTAATVVFDVGGTIQLTSNLDIKDISNVTIAGQTAPGPGISMVGFKFDVTSSNGTKANDITSNIIVRYVADRRGNTISSANDDAIGVLGSTSDPNHNTHDVIMDHVTASWGMDEDLSVTDAATNVTISNSIISEALESGHQFGSLIRPRFGSSVSYIGNLYANNQSRNPRPGSYNNSLLNFDFRNNTIYNWGDRAGYTGGATDVNTEFVNMNYTGNYLIAGPSTPTGPSHTAAFLVDTSQGVKDPLNVQVYQANNLIDTNHNGVIDPTDIGWSAFVQYDGTTTTPFGSNQSSILTTVQESTPFAYPVAASTTTDPTIAYQQTLASAGTTPWNRNPSDVRVVNDVQTNAGAILQTAPTAEYNALVNQAAVSRPAGFDTDGDGMPDSWESARGLNANLASDGNVVVTAAESPAMAGYTWLEMYLNDVTLQANWAGGPSGTWDGILNWNGQLPNLQDSTANFSNIGSAGQITVGSDEHVGQLALDNPAGYTFSGPGRITMDVLSHNNAGFATVTVASGTQTIAVPLNLISNTHFTVAASSLLDVTGNLTATGQMISKDGGGNVRFNNVLAAGLSITNGDVLIRQSATPNAAGGISAVGSLGIAAGSSLDLTNNALIVPYASGTGTASTAVIRGMLQGNEITSSVADAAHRLGYFDNALLGDHNLGGGDPGTNADLVLFLFAGDTNDSGAVDDTDFQTFESNYGATSGATWNLGDFDYNGTVDANDFRLLIAGMLASGQTPGPDVVAFGNSIGVPVPEPTTLSILGLAGLGLLRRRS